MEGAFPDVSNVSTDLSLGWLRNRDRVSTCQCDGRTPFGQRP